MLLLVSCPGSYNVSLQATQVKTGGPNERWW